MFLRTRKSVVITGAAAAVVVVGALVTWLVWPTAEPPPRQREYRALTACLLTDEHGLMGQPAKDVWAGMQKASLATLVRVQYLAVPNPQTAANALAYFNSLALQKCTMIIVAGQAPVEALLAGKANFPAIHYVAVGTYPADPTVTVVSLSPAESIAPAVESAVTKVAQTVTDS